MMISRGKETLGFAGTLVKINSQLSTTRYRDTIGVFKTFGRIVTALAIFVQNTLLRSTNPEICGTIIRSFL